MYNNFCPQTPPNGIPPLWFNCQTTLPSVYDDSLSYYELLNKVVAQLNTVTDSQNNLTQRFNRLNLTKEATVITPEVFGAKGDGVTDDYIAIQKMFDETRGGVIVFNPYKQYRITQPLFIWGGYSTLTILLGSILYDGLITDNAVITLKEELSKGDNYGRGGIKILGGYVNANKMCGCGVRIYNTYHSCLTNVKIANFMQYGIDIGSDDVISGVISTRSTQAIITGCYIDNFANGFNGSCIRVLHTDNNISNCVTNGGQYGIELVYGGNFISNTHFTLYADVTKNPNLDMAFVYNNVINATAVQTNSFDNCYFNGSTKYVVQNNKDNSLVTVFNGCSVILGRDTVGYTCYIKNNFDSALQINDLNVRKSDKTKFIGLITQAQTAGILSRTSATVKNGATRTQNDGDIINMDTHPAISGSTTLPITQNKFRRVLTILSPASLNVGSSFKIYIGGHRIVQVTTTNAVDNYVNVLGDNTIYADIHLYRDKDPVPFDFGNGVKCYGYNFYLTTDKAQRDILITTSCNNSQLPYVHQFAYTGNSNDFTPEDLTLYTKIF